MKFSILIFMSICLMPFSSLGKDWRGIVPLHSTRAEVEKLLGPPEIDRGDMIFYNVEFNRVSFHFPQSTCGGLGAFWNVSRNTVTDIWISPKVTHELKFSDLNLGNDFRRERDVELAYILNYINDDQGISYQVDISAGTVTLIKYFGGSKDKSLRCPVP